ncbi:hypothetical protein Tco_0679979 [Tanacetum coccineum]|uniref:Transposase n=1 Tax=Tanacetum coccineum TaxID=301880 RepID=A0ABQ4XJA9_9ASTR
MFQVDHGLNVDLSSRMPTVVGRKRVQIDMDEVSQIPLRRRSNIRSLAKSMNVSKSTMHRRIKEGVLRPHTNAIKPSLTSENERARLEFCLSKISRSLSSSSPVFHDMFDVVHIDEKWFYMSRPSKRYYLVPGENEPLRTCKSKKFMTKVMFLAAVARPRFDASCNEVFSGKIGIYPLTTLEPAKRSSKNRVAGTLETKPILSVTKEITRSWLIQKVLPDIRAKWPRGHTGPIYIQQDNARPHIDVNDSEFLEAASRDGFDIRLCFQPPNSPDLNVLDLGFFSSNPITSRTRGFRYVKDFKARENQSLRTILESLSRNYIITANDDKVNVTNLQGKTVSLYVMLSTYKDPFDFTGTLVKVNNELKAKDENFEIVIIPLDD